MSSSDKSLEPVSTTQQEAPAGLELPESDNSMQEFYRLYQQLLLITFVLTGIAFICVWIFYSANIALNYLIGACAGMLYLRMLAKDVERLGGDQQTLSKGRLALFAGLIIVAAKWQQLSILPIFLGFLTYKATLLVYMLQTLFTPNSK